MKPYSTFRPTGFDARGAFLDDRQDWLVVPVSRTRDSGPLAESNFAAAERIIGAVSTDEDFETHRFGHWGPGWFEIIIVRPYSLAAVEAQSMEDSLAYYPILDETDYSNREWEGAQEVWTRCYNIRERVELIQEHNERHPDYPVSIFAARHNSIPHGDNGYIFDRCRPEE